MKRGEIWTAAGGGYASKPRPVLIVQADQFDATHSVTVVLITSADVDAPHFRIPLPTSVGLSQESYVMADKVMTLPRANVREFVGRVTATQMVEIERALILFFGIAE